MSMETVGTEGAFTSVERSIINRNFAKVFESTGGAIAGNVAMTGDLALTGNQSVSGDQTVGGAETITGLLTLLGLVSALNLSPVARTATAAGTGTGTVANKTGWVTITCDDANKIIILPAPVVGSILFLANGTTGYELRSSTPASISINGGAGADAESAIPASALVVAICVTTTKWLAFQIASDGTITGVEAAA